MGWQDDPVVGEPAPASPAPARMAPSRSSIQGGLTAGRAAFPPGMMERLRPVAEAVAPAVIPTALQAIPPAASVAFPANLPFVPAEQGVLGLIGTGLNKALGISDPSAVDYALAGGVPPALGYAANIARAVKPFVPMSKAAETMQPMAHTEALNAVQGLRTGQNPTTLFQQATKSGVQAPLAKTGEMLQTIEQEIANATPAGKSAWQSILKKTGIADEVAKGSVTPAKLQNLLADVGKLQSQAAREGGLKADKLGKLFSALSEDLDQVPALAQARAVFKRETVLDEINQSIRSAFRLNAGQDVEKFSPNKVVNALQDQEGRIGKFFAQAFTPTERKETIEFFKFLNTIPGLSPPSNVAAGSMKVMRGALVGGSAGMAAAKLMGLDPAVGAPLGTAAGMMGGPAIDIGETMWKAWHMPGGKAMIKSLLANSDGALTPQVIGALGEFVASRYQNRPAPPTQPSNLIRPPTGSPQPFAMQE